MILSAPAHLIGFYSVRMKVLGDQNGDCFIGLKLTFSYANSASYGPYCRSRIHLPNVCILADQYGLYLLYWVRLMHLPAVSNVVIWYTLLQYVLVQTHRITLYNRNFLTSVHVFSDSQNFSKCVNIFLAHTVFAACS